MNPNTLLPCRDQQISFLVYQTSVLFVSTNSQLFPFAIIQIPWKSMLQILETFPKNEFPSGFTHEQQV